MAQHLDYQNSRRLGPNREKFAEMATAAGLSISDADVEPFRAAIDGILQSYERLELLYDSLAPQVIERHSWTPDVGENRLGAWYRCTRIRASEVSGDQLRGRSVAIKDNICVAGVPMACGSDILDGFVPQEDATVVSRVLAAGGTIAGKAVCENLCQGASSFTSASGPVHNPRDFDRSAGGSSSGCAALVAEGTVDFAIGGDQGGSIRGPASWCGIIGLKPTYGLVPYTGAMTTEPRLDTLGPMARTARDAAILLSVLAGVDHRDPRQFAARDADHDFLEGLDGVVAGSRIGLVREGFGWPGLSDPEVDEVVRQAGEGFKRLGAEVVPVEIPWHRSAIDILQPMLVEGNTVVSAFGGASWLRTDPTDLRINFIEGRYARNRPLPLTAQIRLLTGIYALKTWHGRHYAMAHELSKSLTNAYEMALADFDALLMPTLPVTAPHLPKSAMPADVHIKASSGVSHNTCASNITGHPAVSFPCGMLGHLPVGGMLVGRRFADGFLLRLAHRYENDVFAVEEA